jgi:hypothetical protein
MSREQSLQRSLIQLHGASDRFGGEREYTNRVWRLSRRGAGAASFAVLPLFSLFACQPSRTAPVASSPPAQPAAALHSSDVARSFPACLGDRRAIQVVTQRPFYTVRMGSAEGPFLVDYGSNGTSIEPAAFTNGPPTPAPQSTNQYDQFEFFGSWGRVQLFHTTYPDMQPRQAGRLGTDFLSLNPFTIDYANSTLYRGRSGAFCADSTLQRAGFSPVPTRGYSSQPDPAGPPNVPSVPVRIGTVRGWGLLDTGFDDTLHPNAVNINRAYFNALARSGVTLVRDSTTDHPLGTCEPNVTDQMTGYRLPAGTAFEIVGANDAVALSSVDARIFLKTTPPAAQHCGGISTHNDPEAQIGASFYVRAGHIIIDPISQRVWFGTRP